MYHQRTIDAAKGKWKGILLELGVSADALSGKHGPCPLCGGEDRFRFDNKDGSGSYICNACGAGYGMQLAMAVTGQDFSAAASRIDQILGNVTPDTPARPTMTDAQRRDALRAMWLATKPVAPGDLAHKYLTARGVEELVYPKALRFGSAIKDGEGGVRPCMLAMVGVYGEGRFCAMHRTFLRPDGLAKAEMANPRKMTPGELPDGACVQLSEWTGTGTLGVAEGIETAMSASALFGIPVWATISTALMKKWTPPPGCEEVAIFADSDPKFGGQSAAYHLAHRLATAREPIPVTVHVPQLPGTDFNDELLRKRPTLRSAAHG